MRTATPSLHQCTRCAQAEHEPTSECDGKSRAQRRRQTQLSPKCACGNTATSGYADCGACREKRIAREDRSRMFLELHRKVIEATEMNDIREILARLINIIENDE